MIRTVSPSILYVGNTTFLFGRWINITSLPEEVVFPSMLKNHRVLVVEMKLSLHATGLLTGGS